MINLFPKQETLLRSKGDTIVYGGARGGGKTYGVSAVKAILDIVEWYSEAEVRAKNIDISTFRNTSQFSEYKELFYFKYLIDYPEYQCVIVRKSKPQLTSNTLTECKKVFPNYNGKWIKSDQEWIFPSGAKVYYRPLGEESHREWFQGNNVHRLIVEELTQFSQEEIEEIEFCCRSTHPFIKSCRIYTTNPGKRGHKWVKEKYIDTCPALPDGEKVFLDEFKLWYQPLKPNKIHVTKSGETYLFIPSLVFDNPHLAENDKTYIRNMMNKNEILRQMWLFGNWDVFAGQFFEMWEENIHVVDELTFFDAKDDIDLIVKRRKYDWSNWRLFASNDYGFADRSAWACGFYAVNNDTDDIIKFAEIVRPKLTISQQVSLTISFLDKYYDLKPDDFELHIGDPKSYWQRRDKAEGEFWTFADVYMEKGIYLTKGYNDREPGAMAVLEALHIREDGTPRLRVLSNCTEMCDSIPNLPADPHNPNDVDTTAFDHPYDELRYFIMVLIGEAPVEQKRKTKSWRDKLRKHSKVGAVSWKAA